jgi:cytosine/uracil/thiamine/allantoin permease
MAAGGYMAQLITNETDMVTLTDIDDLDSELCNRDLAPTAFAERHWNTWHLMSLWIGMAVCIPTYMLASYMITDGLSWKEALLIIFLGNLIVSIPMVFNGHAGTRYGIPFPVMGRASFGIKGVHIPSILRALVACGWFGVQTWMGGLALFSIFQQLLPIPDGFVSKFACFMLFWLVNMYFVWKGTESIKILETLAAPLLIVVGLGLLGWGVQQGGGLGNVLAQSEKLQQPSVVAQRQASGAVQLQFNTLTDRQGTPKAQAYRIVGTEGWTPIPATAQVLLPSAPETLQLQVQGPNSSGKPYESSVLTVKTAAADAVESPFAKLHKYILWLTAMVGFWATLALNIPDITRYAKDQKSQFSGQFLGLPTTMALYSFIGIAVTCAAILIFPDVLIKEDAPWDPVTLIGKLDSPVVIIFAQFMLIIATLSTNIVANVIAPAMSFTNAFPKLLSFRAGGILAGLIGIALCPWWLTGQISGFLLNYSAVLGPLVAIMLADYYAVRRTRLDLLDLYRKDGQYAYGGSGFNGRAFLAFGFGLAATYSYLLMPSLEILYHASWFTGFLVAYISYRVLMIGRAPAYT